MKKKILILLISIFLIIPIFSFVNIVNSETEPVYYSDLFYGYDSDYLSSDYLTRYHNNSSYINTKVFNDYVNDPNFYWIKLRSAFSITADTSKLVQLISDGYAGTSFTYNNLLDSVSIDFAKEMMNSALLHQADETIGTVNSMLGKINLLSSQIQKIDNIEIATETEKVTGIYQVVIDNHVFEYLSVEQIRNVLFEIPINKANTKAIADFFSAGKSTMDLCNALSTALVIEDFREGIINEIIDNTPKGTALHEGMTRLRNQIKNGWWTFFVNNYLTKTVLDKCLGVAKEALSLSPMTVKIVQGIISVVDLVVFDMIFNIPTVEDILRQQILTTYSDQLYNILLKKKVLFSTDQFISDDIFVYENIFNAYVTASKLALQQSKSIAPSQEDKNYINSMYNISYAEYIGLIKQQIENITPSSRKTKFFNNYVVNGAVNYKGPSDVIESNTIYTFNGAFNGNMAISKYSSINTTDKNINIKGRLTINNEFSVNSHNLEVDSLEINEYMLMDDPNSYVLINGDLIIHNCKNRTYTATFNEGTIEVKGSLIDDGGDKRILSTSNYFNFIFSGDKKQTVQTSNNLGNIKVNSPGLITNFLKASSLQSDVNIYGDNTYIEIKNPNKHTIYHKGNSIQLSGNIYNLETTGDVLINDWFSVNVDSCMLIDGDLKVGKYGKLNIGSAFVEAGSLESIGSIVMDDVNSYMLIDGDARICESYEDVYFDVIYSSFTKGTMEIKGNFTNIPLPENARDYPFLNEYEGFKRAGYINISTDFSFIFSGNQTQTVELQSDPSKWPSWNYNKYCFNCDNCEYSFRFGDIKISNPNVIFKNKLLANSIDNDVCVMGDYCEVYINSTCNGIHIVGDNGKVFINSVYNDVYVTGDNCIIEIMESNGHSIYHEGEQVLICGTIYGIESSGDVRIGGWGTVIENKAIIAGDLDLYDSCVFGLDSNVSQEKANITVAGDLINGFSLDIKLANVTVGSIIQKEPFIGYIGMNEEESYFLVNGDCSIASADFNYGNLEIKGNLDTTQKESYNHIKFFKDFNLILSGNSIQTLNLGKTLSDDYGIFGRIKVTSPGLEIDGDLRADSIDSDINIYNPTGDIKINNYRRHSVNIYDWNKNEASSLKIPYNYSKLIYKDGEKYIGDIKEDSNTSYSVNYYLADRLVETDSSYVRNSLILKPKITFGDSNKVIGDWYLDKSFENKWNFDFDTINDDISLYADITVWPTSIHCLPYIYIDGIGSTYRLSTTLIPYNSTKTNLTYTVDDEDIITVDETGLITTFGCGTATITIKTENNLTFECRVNVQEHVYSNKTTEPNCTEQGYTTYFCELCGDEYIDDYVEALGHDTIEVNVDNVMYDDLPISKYYYCKRCDKYYIDSEGSEEIDINMLISDEHCFDNGTTIQEATCYQKGIVAYVCANCGYQYFEEVDLLDHNLETIERNEPTCEDYGNILHYRCIDCEKLFDDEEGTNKIDISDTILDPLGHDLISSGDLDATIYDSGYKNGLICNNCEKVIAYPEPTEATGFSMDYSFLGDLKNEMLNNLSTYFDEDELLSVPTDTIIDSSLVIKTKKINMFDQNNNEYECDAIDVIENNVAKSTCGYFSIYPSLQLIDNTNNAYMLETGFVKLPKKYQIKIQSPIELLDADEDDGIITKRHFSILASYINDAGEIVTKELPTYMNNNDICFESDYLTTFAICYVDSREPDDIKIESKDNHIVISTKSKAFLKKMYESNDRSIEEGIYLRMKSQDDHWYLLGNYTEEISGQIVVHNDFELDNLDNPTQLYIKSEVLKKWFINNGAYELIIQNQFYNSNNYNTIDIKCGIPSYPEDIIVVSDGEGITIESKDDNYIKGIASVSNYEKEVYGSFIILDNNDGNDLNDIVLNNYIYKDIDSGEEVTSNLLNYNKESLSSSIFISKETFNMYNIENGNYELRICNVPGYNGIYTTNVEVMCGKKEIPSDLLVENINGDIVISSKDHDYINSLSAFTDYDNEKYGGMLQILDNEVYKQFMNIKYSVDDIEYEMVDLVYSVSGDCYTVTLKSNTIAESGIVNGEYNCYIYLEDYGESVCKINITKGAKIAPEVEIYEDEKLEALVIKSDEDYLKDLCRVSSSENSKIESYILFENQGNLINNSSSNDDNNIAIEYDETNNIAFIKYSTLNALGIDNGSENIIIHSYQWQEKALEFEITSLNKKVNQQFNISYYVGDGINSLNNPSTYDGTEKIELLNPTRDNSVFCGWYTDESCLTKKESIEIGETGDITLYALFRTNQYNVVFHDDDLSYTQGGLTSGANNKLTTLGEIGFNKNGYQFFAWIDEYGNQYLDGSTIYSLCDDNESVDLYAIWTQNSDNDTSIVGATVTTNGTMDVNYYVELNDTGIKNYLNDYQMKVSYGTKESIISPSINSIKYIDDEDGKKIPTFSFSFSLAPKDITQTMRVQLQKKDIRGRFINQNESITYSIQTYYENMLESGSAVMKDVAAAALNYSAYAQQYFGININNLANKNIDDYGYSGIYTDLSNFEIPNSELYHKEKIIGIKGFSFIGNSIILKSDIRIRFYYNYSGNINDLTFECNSKDFVVGKSSQGNYIEIQNITALDIDNIYTLNVYDKKGNSAKMTYSVYNYIISKCNDSDKKLSDLVKSIYLYNKAAEAKVK